MNRVRLNRKREGILMMMISAMVVKAVKRRRKFQ